MLAHNSRLSLGFFDFVLLILSAVLSMALPDDSCSAKVCTEPTNTQGSWALLQAGHKVARPPALDISAVGIATRDPQEFHGYPLDISAVGIETHVGINPSGAAAPLNEDGYGAVADRCCQAEMQEFIRRHMADLNLEVCEEAGMLGIVPYHSCEKGPQTFAALTANLLQDSSERCTWLANIGDCKPMPEDCPKFSGALPVGDCSCSRSRAAHIDLVNGQVTKSNLGGLGPDTGAQEFRISNAGTSNKNEAFDMVITTETPYFAKYPQYNGLYNGFGAINIAPPGGDGGSFSGTVDFKFTFYAAGTSTPLEMSEVHLAIFDLDGTATDWGIEYASSSAYKGYVTDVSPSILATRLPDGKTQFVGSGSANNLPNPRSPETLTDVQRRNSVMYFYVNVSSFVFTFGVEQAPSYASAGNGRYVMFAGTSSLNDRCAD